MKRRTIIYLLLTLIIFQSCIILMILKPKNMIENRPGRNKKDKKSYIPGHRTKLWGLAEKLLRLKLLSLEDLNIKPIPQTNDTCVLGPSNDVSTTFLPMEKHFEKWWWQCGNCVMSEDGEMRFLSAFVYDDHIAVVTSYMVEKQYRRIMYCHYYDCNRKFIGTYESILFPLASVRCVRRIGADFISLSFNVTEIPPDPIPIVNRIGEPKHEIGVCGGQIYGKMLKAINFIEFIEHHRLLGASFFYMTIFDTDEPMYRVIHDYERLGLLDPFWVNLDIRKISPKFHMIQSTDCYYRSRMHSKWTINIDHDERLIMKNPPSLSQLFAKLPANVVSISFPVSRIPITDEVWVDKTRIFFENYKNISRPIWWNQKSMAQQAYTYFPAYHWNYRMETGLKAITLNSTFGYIRHYRISLDKYMTGNWLDDYAPYIKSTINSKFSKMLRSNIMTRYNYLFNQRYIRCETVKPEFLAEFSRRDKCVFKNGTMMNTKYS